MCLRLMKSLLTNAKIVVFTSTIEPLHFNHWSYHVPVNPEITAKFTDGNNRRIRCIINGSVTINNVLMSYEDVIYILINKKVREELNLKEGDKVEVSIEKDSSEYGIPMPGSFIVLFDQGEVGYQYFQALNAGKQRSLIYI